MSFQMSQKGKDWRGVCDMLIHVYVVLKWGGLSRSLGGPDSCVDLSAVFHFFKGFFHIGMLV